MPGKQAFKSFLKNPFVFGSTMGILVVFFNISIASLAEGSLKSGYSVFLDNGIFVYLIPLAVGVQMGLFRYHRNLTAGNVPAPRNGHGRLSHFVHCDDSMLPASCERSAARGGLCSCNIVVPY